MSGWFSKQSAPARVPVPTDDPEGVEHQVDEPRAAAPQATVRPHLTRAGQSANLEIGSLELQLADGEPLLAGQRLANAPRDMRRFGLQPMRVAPRGAWRNGRAA
jgi:hypothetical protein